MAVEIVVGPSDMVGGAPLQAQMNTDSMHRRKLLIEQEWCLNLTIVPLTVLI